MKSIRCAVWLTVTLWLLGAAAPAGGQGFLWDGTHWSKSTEDGKLGYLWGVSNLADLEASAAAKAGTVSAVSQAVCREMQRATAVGLMREVDQFYRQHPERVNMTVLEVLLNRQVAGAAKGDKPAPK